MSIAIVVGVVFLFVVAAISLFVVRRAMRLAIRLVVVGALLLVLLIGVVAFWYKFSDSSTSSPSNEKRSNGTQRRAPASAR